MVREGLLENAEINALFSKILVLLIQLIEKAYKLLGCRNVKLNFVSKGYKDKLLQDQKTSTILKSDTEVPETLDVFKLFTLQN